MGGDRLASSDTLAAVGKQIFKREELLKGHNLAGLMSGQGELKPQMGKGFLSMKEDRYVVHIFDKANELFHKWNPDRGVDFNFRDIIEKGTESDLSQTTIAQPLLIILSLLSKYVLEKGFDIKPTLLAGHSAGEYSALAENCLDLDDALELIIARGRITQEEVQRSVEQNEPQTSMYALKRKKTSIELAELNNIPDINSHISLINGKNDFVVWSEELNFNSLKEGLNSLGIRMIELNIPTAFHANTPTMQRIAGRMNELMRKFTWSDPKIPILMNATHQVATTKEQVIEALIANHTNTVDWLESMNEMGRKEIDAAVQFGPGSFLTKQIEQVIPGIVTDSSAI
ncbi:ACP S-malonyltransferase [Candidatus Roizmanbacteria bacterium]|nr:ACP S-malonyltransferase [Candidatus Roizmanbacteria bacterium]